MYWCCMVRWGGSRIDGCGFFFFQAEDGIRDLVRSRGLGDVYKRQDCGPALEIFLIDTLPFVEQYGESRVWDSLEAMLFQGSVLNLSLIHI